MLWMILAAFLSQCNYSEAATEEEAVEWMQTLAESILNKRYDYYLANWEYQTNISAESEAKTSQLRSELSKIYGRAGIEAKQFDDVAFSDEIDARVFRSIRLGKGTGGMTIEKVNEMSKLRYKMMRTFNMARIERPNCTEGCTMDAGKFRIAMDTETDPEVLKRMWLEWVEKAAKPSRDTYPKYIELSNEMSKANGFESKAEELLFYYDDDNRNFEDICQSLWKQIQPLYQKLHNFIRHHLMKKFPDVRFPDSGHIPLHLLGGTYGAYWQHMFKEIKPFENAGQVSFGEQLKKQNYTSRKIYEQAERFFMSLGYDALPKSFWNNSMFKKPDDGRNAVCSASAWDFMKNNESRIKHCGRSDELTFYVAHHEVGHIYYFMAYNGLPYHLRQGANPGFHEAIGDCIGLSTENTNYLYSIGLLDSQTADREGEINSLLRIALHKLVLMPFTLLVDTWRYSVFRGDTQPHDYNRKWWNMRCEYQGISPPMPRSSDDFDAAELRHVTSATPYLRYFVSMILQFQFHDALCKEKGHVGPLHTCNIFNSRKAGKKLWAMLKLGASKPWPDALRMVTNTETMNASAVLEYFRPLSEWLDNQNYPRVPWSNECPKESFISSAAQESITFKSNIILTLLSFLLYV